MRCAGAWKGDDGGWRPKVRDESGPASSPKERAEEALQKRQRVAALALIEDVVDVLQGAGVESPCFFKPAQIHVLDQCQRPGFVDGVIHLDEAGQGLPGQYEAMRLRRLDVPGLGLLVESQGAEAVSFFEIHGG